MKAKKIFKNTSPLCDNAVSLILDFCVDHVERATREKCLFSKVIFRRRTKQKSSGLCHMGGGRIIVSFKHILKPFTRGAYRKRGWCGEYEVRDTFENCVHVTAHELTHSTGERDEDTCELHAADCLAAWRSRRMSERMVLKGWAPAARPARPTRKTGVPPGLSAQITRANKMLREGVFGAWGSTEVFWSIEHGGPRDFEQEPWGDGDSDFRTLRELRAWIAKNGCDGRTVGIQLPGGDAVRFTLDECPTDDPYFW